MKITVKKKEKEEMSNILFDKIPVGCVYTTAASSNCDATLLKLENNEAVLLTYSDGVPWLEVANGFKGIPARRIVGRLTEIVVDEDKQ